MKRLYYLLFVLILSTFNGFSQTREIDVQIMHDGKIMLDTTIIKPVDEARVIIENLVQNYTTEKVIIDSKLTHGLYVFNIPDDSWKEPEVKNQPKHSAQPKLTYEPRKEPERKVAPPEKNRENADKNDDDDGFTNLDLDSLFNEFSKEIDTQWDKHHMDEVVDSLGNSFQHMWEDFKDADFQNDPDVQDIKKDFKDFFEKLMDTRIIIVQDGDTLKFD